MISVYQFIANHPELKVKTAKPTVFAEDPVYVMDLGTVDNVAKVWFFKLHPPKCGLKATGALVQLAEQFRSVASRCKVEEVPIPMTEEVFTHYADQLSELYDLAGDQFVDELLQVEHL